MAPGEEVLQVPVTEACNKYFSLEMWCRACCSNLAEGHQEAGVEILSGFVLMLTKTIGAHLSQQALSNPVVKESLPHIVFKML